MLKNADQRDEDEMKREEEDKMNIIWALLMMMIITMMMTTTIMNAIFMITILRWRRRINNKSNDNAIYTVMIMLYTQPW